MILALLNETVENMVFQRKSLMELYYSIVVLLLQLISACYHTNFIKSCKEHYVVLNVSSVAF